MDHNACRTVFSQVAQQSQVREAFLRNTETGVNFLLEKVIRDFADPLEWAYKPEEQTLATLKEQQEPEIS
jgi:hypothetical protein